MRRYKKMRRFPERAVGWKRLGARYLQRGAAEHARFERADQRGFVEQRAAAHVDEPRAAFHFCEVTRANEMLRFVRVRSGENYVVGLRERVFELRAREDFFWGGGVAFAGAFSPPDALVEPTGAAGKATSDRAVSDDQQEQAV